MRIALIVLIAQIDLGIILKKYTVRAVADNSFESSAKWLPILMAGAAFLMLPIAGLFLVLATYTREDACLLALVIAAWVSLFAPQVDVIFPHSLNKPISSPK